MYVISSKVLDIKSPTDYMYVISSRVLDIKSQTDYSSKALDIKNRTGYMYVISSKVLDIKSQTDCMYVISSPSSPIGSASCTVLCCMYSIRRL